MNWNSNGTSLIRNGTGNSLTNPPSSISTKLIALGVVKLLYSLNQAKIALLNQIQEQHTTTYISLGNTYYQAEIGLSQTLLSLRTILNIQLQLLHFLLGNSYQRNLQLLQISIILTMSLAVIILWIVCNAMLLFQCFDNGIIPQHGSSYNAVIHTQLFAQLAYSQNLVWISLISLDIFICLNPAFCPHTSLHAGSQMDFFLGSQQRHTTDFLQIHSNWIINIDALGNAKVYICFYILQLLILFQILWSQICIIRNIYTILTKILKQSLYFVWRNILLLQGLNNLAIG